MGMHRVLLPARAAMLAALAALALLMVSAPALAQLTPDRTYYGIDREIPITVSLPGGEEAEDGEASIALYNGRGNLVARASVLAGRVDLATFFPILWEQEEPQVLFAQLYTPGDSSEGQDLGTPVGPPLVVQPLLSPQRASVSSSGVQWQNTRPRVFSGLRIYVDKLLKLNTTEGEIVFRLRPDEAPNTVWHIRELTRGGFYTDIEFHRVVPTHPSGKPFVIQVGDPTGSGQGGPGVLIDLEPSELPHTFGVLSMARTPDPDTNGSQFFVALSREATAMLDTRYTGFGEAVSGAETIVAIEQTPLEDPSRPPTHPRAGRPADPPRIVSAELIDAPPFGTGPEPAKRPTDPDAGTR